MRKKNILFLFIIILFIYFNFNCSKHIVCVNKRNSYLETIINEIKRDTFVRGEDYFMIMRKVEDTLLKYKVLTDTTRQAYASVFVSLFRENNNFSDVYRIIIKSIFYNDPTLIDRFRFVRLYYKNAIKLSNLNYNINSLTVQAVAFDDLVKKGYYDWEGVWKFILLTDFDNFIFRANVTYLFLVNLKNKNESN